VVGRIPKGAGGEFEKRYAEDEIVLENAHFQLDSNKLDFHSHR
jgi:hypothetical protein